MTIPTTVGQPEAVELASNLGHTMKWDTTYRYASRRPSNVDRWVCTRCYRAICDDGKAIYGPAKREPCEVAS
jgi:hypothetical protein